MANIKSAKKRVITSEKNRVHNVAQRSAMRTAVKKVEVAITSGNKDAAKTAFAAAEVVLDRASHKGIVSINKAARCKSNMSKRIKALA